MPGALSGLMASTGHSGTHTAVDTLLGMDDEHILALIEAVDGTNRDTIGGLTLDASLIDNVGHNRTQPVGIPGASAQLTGAFSGILTGSFGMGLGCGLGGATG